MSAFFPFFLLHANKSLSQGFSTLLVALRTSWMPIPFLYAICCEQIIKGGEWEALLLKLCNTMCRTSTLYYFMQKNHLKNDPKDWMCFSRSSQSGMRWKIYPECWLNFTPEEKCVAAHMQQHTCLPSCLHNIPVVFMPSCKIQISRVSTTRE